MKRTVYVPRTSYDLSHGSHLVNPDYGIVNLSLVAGANSRKCYLPPDSPSAAPGGGNDNFHFIPEYETIEIHYEIRDKFALITAAKIEIFTRFENVPLWTLDLTPLGADWWAHGKHVVKWDGRLPKLTVEQKGTAAAGGGLTHDLTSIALDTSIKGFRDGYLTLEFPPYKLRLTVTGPADSGGNPLTAWTYWHILLHSIELELGHEEAIPAATVGSPRHLQDKDVRTRIVAKGGVPATGGSVEVVLLSNNFKTSLAEMNTDAGFDQHKTLWDDGPNIPLFAKIRLKDSGDAMVKIDETPKGAVALGGAKFLWDWTDPAENVAGQQGAAAKPLAFLNDAINYYNNGTDTTRAGADHTYPIGDNCHVDRGGKRGPGAKPVFPVQAGYAPAATLTMGSFPFPVVACKTRVWASLSQGWTSGLLKGKTGVHFQPTRMGGDDYVVTVYLAYDKTASDKLLLDAKTEPLVAADAIQKATGKFQIWREVHVARYVTKLASLPGLFPASLAGVQADLQKPYIHLENKMATDKYAVNVHTGPGGAALNYNTLLRARLTGTGNIVFTQNLAASATADHSTVDSMVKVNDHGDFITAVHTKAFPANAASDINLLATATAKSAHDAMAALPGTNPAAAGAAAAGRLNTTKTWLVTNGVETPVKYAHTLDDILFSVGEPFAGDLQLIKGGNAGGPQAVPGVTTLEFRFTNTALRDLFAAGVSVPYWYGAAIDPPDADRNHCVIMFWLAGVDLFSHEFGHHLFLPHARYGFGSPPGGNQPNRHDDTDTGCLMSYSNVRPGYCGLCQLRMRGWSAAPLNKISASNKKP